MNAIQYQDAVRVMAKSIGGDAEIFTSISLHRCIGKDYEGVICASIYPHGMTRGRSIDVYADDFDTLLALLTATWEKHFAAHRKQTIRKIALRIIEITADNGACHEAALRMTFSQDQIAAYGKEACADANEIADKGPFSIAPAQGANGTPADARAYD